MMKSQLSWTTLLSQHQSRFSWTKTKNSLRHSSEHFPSTPRFMIQTCTVIANCKVSWFHQDEWMNFKVFYVTMRAQEVENSFKKKCNLKENMLNFHFRGWRTTRWVSWVSCWRKNSKTWIFDETLRWTTSVSVCWCNSA